MFQWAFFGYLPTTFTIAVILFLHFKSFYCFVINSIRIIVERRQKNKSNRDLKLKRAFENTSLSKLKIALGILEIFRKWWKWQQIVNGSGLALYKYAYFVLKVNQNVPCIPKVLRWTCLYLSLTNESEF